MLRNGRRKCPRARMQCIRVGVRDVDFPASSFETLCKLAFCVDVSVVNVWHGMAKGMAFCALLKVPRHVLFGMTLLL